MLWQQAPHGRSAGLGGFLLGSGFLLAPGVARLARSSAAFELLVVDALTGVEPDQICELLGGLTK